MKQNLGFIPNTAHSEITQPMTVQYTVHTRATWGAGKGKSMTSCACVADVTSCLSDIFNIISMAGTDTEKKPVLEMVSVINVYLCDKCVINTQCFLRALCFSLE